MPPEPGQPELRASDADREAVVERLRTAAIEGRLNAEELEARVSAAYAARWGSGLDRLTADVTPAADPRPGPPVFVQQHTTRINPYAIAGLVLGYGGLVLLVVALLFVVPE